MPPVLKLNFKFRILTPIVYSLGKKGKNDPSRNEFTWIKSIVFVLGSMTQRGWDCTPNGNDAARISFFV